MAACGGVSESKGAENYVDFETIAKFAVEEHNRKQVALYLRRVSDTKSYVWSNGIGNVMNAALQLVKVVRTEEQVVQGMNYFITLEVNEGGETKTYEAKVWVKPWESFQELQEFNLVA